MREFEFVFEWVLMDMFEKIIVLSRRDELFVEFEFG